MASTTLGEVYAFERKVTVHPETLAAYALPWGYDGGSGYAQVCGRAVASFRLDGGRLVVRVYAAPGERCWEAVLDRGWLPVLDGASLEPYYDRARGDPLLDCVSSRLRMLTLRRLDAWQAFVVAVCQQNASFQQGWKMVYRVHQLLGERIRLPSGRVYVLTPPPSRVTVDALRAAGLGYRAETLARVAAVLSRLDYVVDPGAAREAFSVKGVGPYTRGLVELLALGRLDAYIVDRWIAALASEAYGVAAAEAGRLWVERWRPWQGLASLHLTIVFDAEPLRRSLQRLREGRRCPEPRPGKPTPLTLWRELPMPS